VAMRPEMTPTFARMVASRASQLAKPVRWFSVPQLYRYERPQRGRLREHYQLNMDILGDTGPAGDAEIIAAAIDVLRELGLTADDIVVRLSDRVLVGDVLAGAGLDQGARMTAFAALDRLEKAGRDAVLAVLHEQGIDGERVFGAMESAFGLAPGALGMPGAREDVQLPEATAGNLGEVFALLEHGGYGPFVQFDPGLVRGLAYYTDTVFEIWERTGELRAICGGGRYDTLLASLTRVDLPAAGFGMGDVVLGELLGDRGLVPESSARIDDYVVCVSEDARPAALRLARQLRDTGRRVRLDLHLRGVGKQFKAANRCGAGRAIVLGPEELARGVAKIREMAGGGEVEVSLETLARTGGGPG